MYNDPNKSEHYSHQQKQPFTGQLQPLYKLSSGTGSLALKPSKKGYRRLWVILGIVIVLLLSCGGGVFALTHTAPDNPATATVNQYFTAIQNQDYVTAFGYIDQNVFATQNVSLDASKDGFIYEEQALDATKGKVTNYTITSSTSTSKNGANTADFTVSVTRGSTSYDVHLQLQQEGDEWKIINFDNY